ncbi:MAG: tRNA (guanine(26)-N(2))-dimethyltransferase [Methanobrevibacter sp.]|jgi:tRNA (guanine26-N2/guanine27-N2)-dimethyltransferase|nr:tRNA (guanine(26)-N(2))-dimethyltransferase [Candidatus Methanoflexus mossambicus]
MINNNHSNKIDEIDEIDKIEKIDEIDENNNKKDNLIENIDKNNKNSYNFSNINITDNDYQNIDIVEEGNVKIAFPCFDKVSSSAPVFYNPKMELNRDLSILALQTFQKEIDREINICDLFGGSGIRGIRYKKEINSVGAIGINDISSNAMNWGKYNAQENNVKVDFFQKEANIFLRENRGLFDVIDIDPFGTPSFFLDSACYTIKKDGMLCVTATDTSALCGTYKEPCIRKYNALPYKSEYCHETGIRILAGFVALTLAKYKKYMEIKFAHSSEHYMRMYLKINKGSAATDNSIKENIGHITHCPKCLYRNTVKGLSSAIDITCPICGYKMKIAGPLWIGSIENKEFINKMLIELDNKQLNTKDEILKLLTTIYEESESPITFYDIHKISKNIKTNAPKQDKVFEAIKDKGYTATKTHFNLLGIKTDVDIESLKEIVIDIIKNES